MATKTIHDFTAVTSLAGTDEILAWIVGSNTTRKITWANALTNATLVTPTIASFANAQHNHQNAAGGGTIDHGAALTGLSDDDHAQYLLATGTRTGATSQAQTFTNGIVGPTWKPASDSTTALRLQDSAGATTLFAADTTNARIGIGTTPTAKLDVATTVTTTSTTTNGVLTTVTVSPTGASTAEIRALSLSTTIDTVNGFSGSGLLLGVRGEMRVVNAGSLGMTAAGIAGYGLVAGSSAASLTSATEICGGLFFPISSFSNSLTATITRAIGVFIRNSSNTGSGPLTITGQAGLLVAAISGASNNSGIVLGQSTIPSGNYGIYNASTNDNWLAGKLGVGTGASSPGAILDVRQSDSGTNAIANIALLDYNSSGTAAAGFGLGILARLESSTTVSQSAGRLTWAWDVATHASRAAIGKLTAYYTSTEREAITWTATSTGALVGVMTASPQRTLDVNGTIRISGSDALFTTSSWGKYIEYNNGAALVWLKNGATYAHGAGATDGGFYWFRSTADDASAAPTYDMVLTDAGRLGLGTASPQSLLHGYDGSGGFMFVNRAAVDGTLVTVIPNGTGDVTENLSYFGYVKHSGGYTGTVAEGDLSPANYTIVSNAGNELTFGVASDGSFTLQRTAGTGTWNVCLWVIWR